MTKPKTPSDETSIATVPRRSRSSARTLSRQHSAPAGPGSDDPRLTIGGRRCGHEDYASASGRIFRVFDPAAFRAALDEDDAAADYMGPEAERPVAHQRLRTSEDEVWARVVCRIAADPCEGWRDVLVGDEAMVARLTKAAETSPHFAAVTDLILRAVIASALTGERVRFPPVLMLSEPGVGKTHYAASIARAMGICSVPLALNATSDRGQLSGLSSAWRGAKMGRFAKTVIEGDSASPLFLLDEIDKCSNIANENVAAVLLSVLEPENARNFVDEYLDVPIRLDQALWLASANDIQAIPPPLLSRMLVVEVPRPTIEQARTIVKAVARATVGCEIVDDAVDLLTALSARQARQAIEVAYPHAVCERREILTIEDVRVGLAFIKGARQRSIGFMS